MGMDLQAYKNHLEEPWGKIYYDIVFKQLEDLDGKRILDFGSGFGIVANFLAEKNQVTAVETDMEMMIHRKRSNPYEQLQGSLDVLEIFPDEDFDVIICHNVLEYVEDVKPYLEAFSRLLKLGGHLSIVKHNHVGRILHTVIFENDTYKAQSLLLGESYKTHSMGQAVYYEISDVIKPLDFEVESFQGVRIFYGLQPNDVKTDPGWREKMLAMELAVYEQSPYRDIAAFQHYWLKKR